MKAREDYAQLVEIAKSRRVNDATSKLEHAFDRSKSLFLEEAQSILKTTLESPGSSSKLLAASAV